MNMVATATVAAATSTQFQDAVMSAAMATISASNAQYLDDKYWVCDYYKYSNASLNVAATIPDDW